MSVEDRLQIHTGGFSVGRNRWLAVNGPGGVLEVYRDKLVLDVTWGRYAVPRSAVVALSIVHVLFWRLLRIEHAIPEHPRFLGFTSFRMPAVLQQLEEAGYHVTTYKA